LVYPSAWPQVHPAEKIFGKETWSTIGTQKKSNYALQDLSREEFIKSLTTGLSTPPQSFALNAKINKQG
jgi:hypothetical protein